MIVRHGGEGLCIEAPAKVNLHLEIIGKREDGYHELETLIVAVDLYDELIFQDRPSGTVVHCSDPAVAEGEGNLVWQAARLVRERSECSRGVEIVLNKRIPVRSGLAGGSSDAAATLAGLNLLWGLGWPEDRLSELGAELGSDVPFFFHTPAAVCRGRGEKVTDCSIGQPLHLVLVHPKEGLATKTVYQHLKVPREPVPLEPIVSALEKGEVGEVGRRLHNRLEEVATGLSGAVADLKQRSVNWDCLGRRLSGSGSCFYGLCSSSEQAQELGRKLRSENLGSVFVVRSGQ